MTNQVSPTDVTYLALSMAAFAAASTALSSHDYWVAAGSAILGVLFTYFYHLFGTPTVPEGTKPVVTVNPIPPAAAVVNKQATMP